MKTKLVSIFALLGVIVCIFLYLSKNKAEENTGFLGIAEVSDEVEKPATSKAVADLPDPFADSDQWEGAEKDSHAGQPNASAGAEKNPKNMQMTDKKRGQIHDVLQVSGVERRLRDYSDNVRNQFDLAVKSGELAQEDADRIAKVFQETVDPDAILKEFEEKIANQLSSEDLKYIDEELVQNETYQKLQEFEESLSDPHAMEGFQKEFMSYMEKNNGQLPKEHQKRVEDYDQATGGSKLVIDLAMEMMESAGVTDAETRESTKKMMQQQYVQAVGFATRNIPSNDMNKLIKVVGDERVKTYNGLYTDLIKVPMSKAMAKIAPDLQRAMERNARAGAEAKAEL